MQLADALYMGGDSSNPINRTDTRIKIVFVLVALSLVLLAENVQVSVYFMGLSLGLVLLADVSPLQFAVRLVAPFVVIGALVVIQMFYYGSAPLWTMRLPGGVTLILYREGFWRGIFLAARVGGGVSLLILLSLTSSVLSILASLRWFRVPRIWLEVLFIAYRYLFVMLEHLVDGYQAQRSRLGYVTLGSAMGSAGVLAAHLFLHVFDQTVRTFEAMRLRGYQGFVPLPGVTGRFSWLALAAAGVLVLPGLILQWA